MTQTITLRPMTEDDIAEASALKSRVFNACYAGHVSQDRIDQYLAGSSSVKALTERLAQPERRLVVCEIEGVQVGGAILKIDGDVGYLSAVWVAPEHRRQGIGLALAQWREAEAERCGCTRLQLHVWRENPLGTAFALARGYKLTGQMIYDDVTDSRLDEYERPIKDPS